VGNESLCVVGVSGSLEEILPVVLCNFLLSLTSLGIPLPGWSLVPTRGDSLLRVMRSVVYGWEVHGRFAHRWCTSIKR
jgi:hypothetical protein